VTSFSFALGTYCILSYFRRNAVVTSRLQLLLLFALSFAVAWWWSSPALLIEIDWDNASHLNEIIRAEATGMGGRGYTAHMTLIPLYALGARLVRPFGGDPFDGMRLVNGLSVALATTLLWATLRRRKLGALGCALICVAWLTSIDTSFLVRTVEDDCVTLAVGALVFWLMLAEDQPRPRRIFFAGLALGTGWMINYAAIVWLPVLLAWAATLGGASWRERLLRALSPAAGFLSAAGLFAIWFRLHDWGWGQYFETLAMPPNNQLASMPNRWALVAYFSRYLPQLLLTPGLARLAAPGAVAFILGLLAPLLIGAVVLPWLRQQVTPTRRALSVIALALLLCSLPAAIKQDWTVFERHCHVPYELALAAGVLMAALPRHWSRALGGLVALIALAQSLELITTPRYQSFAGQLALLRREHPAVVLAEEDLSESDFGKTVTATVFGAHVLSRQGAPAHWRIAPQKVILVEDWRRAPIEGAAFSPRARALLGQ
jgi:hypothetical protein